MLLYFLSLVIKKVSFLNFHSEFEQFLNHEREKNLFIFDLPDIYDIKMKEFYEIVFNHCKFIVCVKPCHDDLFMC